MPRWSHSFRSDNERIERDRHAAAGDRDCHRGESCQSAVRERHADGTTARVPAKTPRAFCHADEMLIGSCLRGFPDAHRLLGRMLGYRQTAEIVIRMPFGPSVEIRTDLDEIMRALVDACMAWLERVASVDLTLTVPDTADWRGRAAGPRAGDLIGYAVPRLAERVPALTALACEPMLRPGIVASLGCGLALGPAGDTVLVEASGADAGSEALRLGYLWRAALGLTPAARDDLLGVECEACGKRSLRRSLPPQHDGDTAYFAECGECGALLTDEEFRFWTQRLVRFYSSRVTPAVLFAASLRGNESAAIADASGLSREAA